MNEKTGAYSAMVLRQVLQPSGIVYPRLPRGLGFLIGALSAAFLVLTVAGASLLLSSSTGGAASGATGHYRLPQPALSLGIHLSTLPRGVVG
jgi:hypothetical protein